MTEKDIRLLRNQFYAAHGRSFSDEGLQEYFEEQRWYVPEEGEPESEFTNLEERNIEFLSSIERELSKSAPSTIDDTMELFTIYDDQNVLLPEEVELLNSYSIEPFTKEGLQVLNEAYSKTAFELSYFKPVYEGDIYVRKGAREEYVNYFPLLPSDESGALRDIAPEDGQDTPFSGNLPAFDHNGYLRGLYFAGD